MSKIPIEKKSLSDLLPLRKFVEQSNDGICLIGESGEILEWNGAMERISGLPCEEALGQPFWDVQHNFLLPEKRTPECYESLKAAVLNCLKTGQSSLTDKSVEVVILTRQGEIRYILQNAFSIRTDQGFLIASIAHDITERKQAEQSRRASEDRFYLAMEATSEGLWDWDITADRSYYSPGYYTMLGYEPNEFQLTGEKWRELVHPEDIANVLKSNMDCIENRSQHFEVELRLKAKDGGWKWVLSKGKVVERDDQGRALRMVGTHRDITERKQHESELEVIAAVSAALRSAETRNEILQIVLEQTVKLMRADAGELELIDPATGDAVVEAAVGEYVFLAGTRVPPDKGLNSIIRATGKPYLNNDVRTDPASIYAAEFPNTPAWAGVPMIAQDELIGFLWIGRKTDILESEIRPLSAIADIAASAIRRATLHEQAQTQLKRLAALRKIDTTINDSQELYVIIKAVLEQILLQSHVDAACVYQLKPDLLFLECIARMGFLFADPLPSYIPVNESLASKAIMKKEIVQISDAPTMESLPTIKKEGFISYIAFPLVAKGQVKGVLEVFHRKAFTVEKEWLSFLETVAGQAAIAIDNINLFEGMQHSNMELALAYDATIEGWSRALDLRDKETEGHSERVTDMSIALAVKLGIRGENLVHIRRGALLHDIGKMGVPDRILLKPGKLTEEEWTIMAKHPQYAYDMLSSIDYLRPALDIPYCHHEKWDGSGYPQGLKGEQIPLAARIFAVVDVWDALLSDRPYRKSWTKDQALQYLRDQQGLHFDPQIVRPFLSFIERF